MLRARIFTCRLNQTRVIYRLAGPNQPKQE